MAVKRKWCCLCSFTRNFTVNYGSRFEAPVAGLIKQWIIFQMVERLPNNSDGLKNSWLGVWKRIDMIVVIGIARKPVNIQH